MYSIIKNNLNFLNYAILIIISLNMLDAAGKGWWSELFIIITSSSSASSLTLQPIIILIRLLDIPELRHPLAPRRRPKTEVRARTSDRLSYACERYQ